MCVGYKPYVAIRKFQCGAANTGESVHENPVCCENAALIPVTYAVTSATNHE